MAGNPESQTIRLGHDLPGQFLTPDAQRIREMVDAHDLLDSMRRARSAEQDVRLKSQLAATGFMAAGAQNYDFAPQGVNV